MRDSNRIDYTIPDRVFDVSTVRREGNHDYMGPGVRVNARDAEHAKDVAREHGHIVNRHFEPKEVRKP